MGTIDEKILEEIRRYKSINKYINEQELPPPPMEDPTAIPPAGETPPMEDPIATPPPVDEPPADVTPEPIDTETDPEVEEVGKDDEETEELDITDLVTSQKNVETKQEEYFQNLFNQLKSMEEKLSEMDNLMTSINNLEAKVEKYRPKSAQEKLELRTLDSGPFKQKLSDFFQDKQEEMEQSGKNEYVLTTDEVEDYSPSEIEDSFNNWEDQQQFK